MRRHTSINRFIATGLIALVVLLSLSVFSNAQVAETQPRDAVGRNGMAATAHPLASRAALDMLEAGGNAVDAAVAAAFAIGVVEPDGSGLGGGGGMVVYMHETGQSYYINYYQRTSELVDQIDFDTEADRHTGAAVLIPGTVAGLTMALERFGTMPLSRVLEPAIRYAGDGFEIDATLAQLLLDNIEMLQVDTATAAIYLDEGFPRMQGDILRQPALARTLRIIAEQGRDGFYTGPVAARIIETINERGGAMTLDDFTSYEAELTVPLKGRYRGYDILAANAPQSGEAIIQALNMLENENLAALGHYRNSSATLHLLAETFRRTYADRWQYLGDPDYSYVPINGLISKRFARERYYDINRYKAEPREYRLTAAGNPVRYDEAETDLSSPADGSTGKTFKWDDKDEELNGSYDEWGESIFDSWGGKKKSGDKKSKKARVKNDSDKAKDSTNVFDDPDDDEDDEREYDGHTTHLSIIDKHGNMVALTQTLGTFFGSGITVEGVLLNCGMTNFSRSANANMVAPRKQPRSSISPTVVLKDGKPFCVIGSPGAGRIICTVALLLVNIIDFDMSAVEANAAPRLYCQKYEDYLHLEGGIAEDVRADLERMGHTLRLYEGIDLFFGGAQIILVDPATGLYHGSADPRRGGVALGY